MGMVVFSVFGGGFEEAGAGAGGWSLCRVVVSTLLLFLLLEYFAARCDGWICVAAGECELRNKNNENNNSSSLYFLVVSHSSVDNIYPAFYIRFGCLLRDVDTFLSLYFFHVRYVAACGDGFRGGPG